MKEVLATHAQLAERIATRPPKYMEDLTPSITRRDQHGIWVDVEHPAFVRLAAIYRREAAWGPPLWRVLHQRADATPQWLERFTQTIPCGACREHFGAICRETPPDFGPLWFAWTVYVHNEVNARIGKQKLTLHAARQVFPRKAA